MGNSNIDQTKLLTTEIGNITNLLSNISVIRGFTQPLESEFQQEYLKKNYVSLKLILFLGLILYSCYSVVEMYLIPDWKMLVIIRLFCISSILLIILLLCFTSYFNRYHQLFAVLFSTSIIIGLVVSADIVPILYKFTYYLSLILTIFFLATLTVLQFRYTVIDCLIMLLIFNIGYYYDVIDNSGYYIWGLISNNYILVGAAVVCILTSYIYEFNFRKEFLLEKSNALKSKLLELQSRVDGVTGLLNRRYFDEILTAEWSRALRYHYPITIIFADFDYFKQYNDIYGHPAGDQALNDIASVFSTFICRSGDYIARYGGDEFIAILTNTDIDQGCNIAKEIMQKIKQLSIKHQGSQVADIISITIGIAAMIPTNNNLSNTLLKSADTVLQFGKNMKRGNIYSYSNNEIQKIDS